MPQRMYKLTDAAKLLGMTKDTMRERVLAGKIAAKRDGRRLMIMEGEIDRYQRELADYIPPGEATPARPRNWRRAPQAGRQWV